jgi:hypothetical protein
MVKQEELPNMPPESALGKAAKKLIAIRDKIATVNEELDKDHSEAKDELLTLMDKEKKEDIVVDGLTFRKVHKEASDEIRVLQKKSRKKDEEEED